MNKLIEEELLNKIINDFVNNHYTIKELQEKYKFSRDKITYNLQQKNIDTMQNIRYSQKIVNQVINDYINNCISLVHLSKKYHIAIPTITRWLKNNNIAILPSNIYKQTTIDILQQAAEYYINEKLSIAAAAKKAGISKNTLRPYLKEKKLIRHRYDITKVQYNIDNKPNTKIFNHNIFSELVTEEQYYWLGFIFADGTVMYNTDNYTYILKYALMESDISHLEKFCKFINAQNISIKERIYEKNNKQFKAAEIIFYSKQLVKDLIKYGCIPNKSDNGYLEWQYFINISDKNKCAFLRGYIDGNGTIYSKNLNIKISIHSKQLAEDIYKLILSLNINAKLYYITRKFNRYIYSIEIIRKNDRLNFCKMLYDNAHIYLQRKYNKYQEYLNIQAVQN